MTIHSKYSIIVTKNVFLIRSLNIPIISAFFSEINAFKTFLTEIANAKYSLFGKLFQQYLEIGSHMGVCMCTCVYVYICIHIYLDIYLFKNICKYQHYLHVIYLVFMGHVCCN